jgi:hypothetical protein
LRVLLTRRAPSSGPLSRLSVLSAFRGSWGVVLPPRSRSAVRRGVLNQTAVLTPGLLPIPVLLAPPLSVSIRVGRSVLLPFLPLVMSLTVPVEFPVVEGLRSPRVPVIMILSVAVAGTGVAVGGGRRGISPPAVVIMPVGITAIFAVVMVMVVLFRAVHRSGIGIGIVIIAFHDAVAIAAAVVTRRIAVAGVIVPGGIGCASRRQYRQSRQNQSFNDGVHDFSLDNVEKYESGGS